MDNRHHLIGFLSDTHDQVHHLGKTIRYFNELEVGLVIHCGDWVSPFTLIHYAKLRAPLYGIFGNNDGDIFRHLTYAERFGVHPHMGDHFLVLEEYGRRIAVYHGEHEAIVRALVRSGDYDLVAHGHDHKPSVEVTDGVVSLNPGTLMDYTDEGTEGASIGIYDADAHQGRIIWLREIS